jgi:hypothetical protein
MVRKVATDAQYQAAIAAVRGGSPSSRDVELAVKASKVAGSWGSAARQALENAGKNK